MKDLLVLLAYLLLTTLAKLLGSGGVRAIVADNLPMKQQLRVINRSRKRAPNLSVLGRFLLGFCSLVFYLIFDKLRAGELKAMRDLKELII